MVIWFDVWIRGNDIKQLLGIPNQKYQHILKNLPGIKKRRGTSKKDMYVSEAGALELIDLIDSKESKRFLDFVTRALIPGIYSKLAEEVDTFFTGC
jgi:prophage antirepressor-like protein